MNNCPAWGVEEQQDKTAGYINKISFALIIEVPDDD